MSFIRFSIVLAVALFAPASIAGAQVLVPTPQTQPTSQPATRPADPPATMTDADMARQLKAHLPGSVMRFAPGVYAIANTIVLNQPGTYDMTGVELRGHKGTLLWLRGGGIHVNGVCLNSDFPCTKPQGKNQKVNVQGVIVQATDVWLTNVTWRNVDFCIQLFPGQRYLTLINPTFTDEIRGDALYCGGGDETQPRGDVLWVGGSVANSQQEQNIRCSTASFSHLECYGVSFRNTNGKECFGFRTGHTAKLVDCTFWGAYPTFLGSGLPQELTRCGDITFDHCHFMQGSVVVRFCKDVQVLDCDFRTKETPVSVSDGANVTVKGVRRILNEPSVKPYFRDSTKAGNAITDLGGHVTRMIATTQPATQESK
jgi:hypothetical protein